MGERRTELRADVKAVSLPNEHDSRSIPSAVRLSADPRPMGRVWFIAERGGIVVVLSALKLRGPDSGHMTRR